MTESRPGDSGYESSAPPGAYGEVPAQGAGPAGVPAPGAGRGGVPGAGYGDAPLPGGANLDTLGGTGSADGPAPGVYGTLAGQEAPPAAGGAGWPATTEGPAGGPGVPPPAGRLVYALPGQGRPVPPVLPVVETPYHMFNRAPANKWWKGLLALLLFAATWVVASTVVVGVYFLYEAANNPAILEELSRGELNLTFTPGLYLANNLTIVAMIPAAYLSHWACTGQRPRWLSSVVGGLRWGWLLRCVAATTVLYLVLNGVSLLVSGLPTLEWRSSSVFMIVSILLTTPLQAAGEEIGLRGLGNRAIASWFSSPQVAWWVGAVVTSLVFASLHLASNVALNVFYFSFGMVSCWLVRISGGLEASIAFHVVNNMVASWVLPFTDISHMMDRGAGAVTVADGIQTFAAVLLAPLVLWLLVRREKPVNVGPPGVAGAGPSSAAGSGPAISVAP